MGYIVRPGYKLARRRVVNNLKTKLTDFKSRLLRQQQFGRIEVVVYLMKPDKVYELRQVISSYLGHFKHANTWNLINGLFEKHDWLNEYFFLNQKRLLDRFRYKGVFRSLRSQVNFFRTRLGNTICFIQVGKFYELYGSQARSLSRIMNLRLRIKYRRMSCGIGFPIWLVRKYISMVLARGYDVALIEQTDSPGLHVMERYVAAIYRVIPAGGDR